MTTTKRTILGLDLGRQSDYSALALVKEGGTDKKGRTKWAIPHLQRWPLGTSYVDIVEDVTKLVKDLDRPALIIDRTGCGVPVFDLFKSIRPAVAALVGACITGGAQANQPTFEFLSPMARSMPWTGNGV